MEFLKSKAQTGAFSFSFGAYSSFVDVNEEVAGSHPMEDSGSFINVEGRSQSSVASSTSSNGVMSFVSDFMPFLTIAASLKTGLSFSPRDSDLVVTEVNIGRTVPSILSSCNLS